jgi:hypothetical protein
MKFAPFELPVQAARVAVRIASPIEAAMRFMGRVLRDV